MRKLHRLVCALEPWGIVLAVLGIGLSLWLYQTERRDRAEDRFNFAISQLSDGFGRNEPLSLVLRATQDVRGLKATGGFFPGADLRGRDLSNSNFEGANFEGADFRDTVLDGVNFNGANLIGALFSDAHFDGTSFRASDLSGADFRGSFFRSHNPHDWDRATLADANFKGVTVGEIEPIFNDEGQLLRFGDFDPVAPTSILFCPAPCGNSSTVRFWNTVMPDGSLCMPNPLPATNKCPFIGIEYWIPPSD